MKMLRNNYRPHNLIAQQSIPLLGNKPNKFDFVHQTVFHREVCAGRARDVSTPLLCLSYQSCQEKTYQPTTLLSCITKCPFVIMLMVCYKVPWQLALLAAKLCCIQSIFPKSCLMSPEQAHCLIPVCKFQSIQFALYSVLGCVGVCGGNLPWSIRLVLRIEIVAFSHELSSSLRVLTSALNSSLLTHCLLSLPICSKERPTFVILRILSTTYCSARGCTSFNKISKLVVGLQYLHIDRMCFFRACLSSCC